MPEFSGINHVVFSVRDLAASVSWYENLFGFAKVPEAEAENFQLLMHPGNQVVLGLLVHDSNNGQSFAESTVGLDHLAFHVSSRAELDAWQARFQEEGVSHSPIADEFYGSVLVFRDPDNIQLEMFALPGT